MRGVRERRRKMRRVKGELQSNPRMKGAGADRVSRSVEEKREELKKGAPEITINGEKN